MGSHNKKMWMKWRKSHTVGDHLNRKTYDNGVRVIQMITRGLLGYPGSGAIDNPYIRKVWYEVRSAQICGNGTVVLIFYVKMQYKGKSNFLELRLRKERGSSGYWNVKKQGKSAEREKWKYRINMVTKKLVVLAAHLMKKETQE